MKKILCLVGGRPNFIKIKPIVDELKKNKINYVLVHTGQHYDFLMSEVFFRELNIPKPNYNLNVGSCGNIRQTVKIIERLEPIIQREKPDIVLVVGDMNSALAGALTAAKMSFSLAHVEAGLRSFDKKMQEEINRILIDHLSDFLFVTEPSGKNNLIREGISNKKIYPVGNVMIDTLINSKLNPPIGGQMSKFPGDYAVLTLHRAENVDNKEIFKKIINILKDINIKIIWPLHHRAKKKIKEFGLDISSFKTISPLGYIDFISLIKGAKFVLTDSGGVQEETTFLKKPCLTLRETTEIPVTVEKGTNIIVGFDRIKIAREVKKIMSGNFKKGKIPSLWDGQTAKRIIRILKK